MAWILTWPYTVVTPFRFLALLRQLYPNFAEVGQGGVYMQQDAVGPGIHCSPRHSMPWAWQTLLATS